MTDLPAVQAALDAARCRTPGCRRAPAYPDQAFCAEHQPHWKPAKPAWLQRRYEGLLKGKSLDRSAL